MLQTKFQEALASKQNSLEQSSETSINEQWQSISAATNELCWKNLEPPPRRNADWFGENNESIQSLLHERTAARNIMLNTGLCSKTAKFKECKRNVQSSLRQMKDDWWNKKAEAVQDLAESGNPRAFFKSLKEVYGPRHSVTSPPYNKPGTVLLTNKVDVMDRWKEHSQDLFNRPSSTDPNALNTKDKLPCNADMDIPPSLEEIEYAIKSMKNGKAPGADGIPSEVYKYGGPNSAHFLQDLLG